MWLLHFSFVFFIFFIHTNQIKMSKMSPENNKVIKCYDHLGNGQWNLSGQFAGLFIGKNSPFSLDFNRDRIVSSIIMTSGR